VDQQGRRPIYGDHVTLCPDDFKLYNWVESCQFFEGSHTGVAIAERLDQSLVQLNFDLPVSIYATSDNFSNVICTIENSNHVNEHFCCVYHTMQLCIHDTFQNIDGMQNAVKKCQKIAAHTHHSPLACQSLKNECKKLSILFKKLITMSATRWNSELMNMGSLSIPSKE
jgi:hypothetical protein